jgi:hypothetical protein
MTDKLKIATEDEVHEVDASKINLVFKSPEHTGELKYPDHVPLDAEACIYHMDRVQKFDSRTPELVCMVFKHLKPEQITPDWVRQQDKGVQHLAGRVDMTIKLQDKGVRIMWKLPEAYLHPKWQCELGDLLIHMSNMP